ncbi:MAG TPA: DUF2071 domain-containing protein [Chloroflexota bacterium]|jgi:hypothetical protein|nr:DUF2071 domain-containing protein [Chloroflexota bacterium]
MPLPFLTAEWRHLVMLNFEITREALLPFVPRHTALDLWQGRTLISLVGFQFLRTRVAGIVPLPVHQAFEEVNLRFYVTRTTPDGAIRRGVVFVRELVPKTLVALAARLTYNEPYRAVPMRSQVPPQVTHAPGRVQYEWKVDGAWQGIAATAVGTAAIPSADSEAAFITEHYWGYGRLRDGRTVEYEVTHAPWRVWDAANAAFSGNAAALYDAPFVDALTRPPSSAFIAEGSAVTVHSAVALS